ncbi:hypothetical protein [Paratractidigestivibacter sp.]|uniref:hypothetical protein n=1 Tax=Paratractidigestivibacter sp. TaxID=2847316 RepID=UPI002ACB06A2|nr:hypothetical protein [Paratractidigestivibacter sp.]
MAAEPKAVAAETEPAAPTTELSRPEPLEPTAEQPAVDADDADAAAAPTADAAEPAVAPAAKPSPVAGAREFIVAHKPLAIGAETDASVFCEPTDGVSEDKLRQNVADLLDRAEQKLGSKTGELSLAGIYADGQVDVASSYDAEAKTDAVTLTCAKTGAFDSCAGRIAPAFSFRSVSGLWEITDLNASADAKARGFSPLLAT